MPWRPHSGPNFQLQFLCQYLLRNVNFKLDFCSLVGAWRGDTLIQRSVSNASINKPGGMGVYLLPEMQFHLVFPRRSSLHWGWLSSGITCMAMFATFPSTIMAAAFGRLHNRGGPPSAAPHCCGIHNGGWDGGKHSHTIQVIPDESHPQ